LQSQGNRTKYSVPDQNIIWKNFKFYLDLNTVHPEQREGSVNYPFQYSEQILRLASE